MSNRHYSRIPAAVLTILFATLFPLSGCEESEERSLSVVAFGDWGTGDDNQQAVADALESYCDDEGCDAGWLLGGNFYPQGVASADDPQWETSFEDRYGGLDIPFYAVMGGVDYVQGEEAAAAQVEYSGQNPDWIMPNVFNVLQTPQALVVALDTTLIGLEQEDATEAQAAVFSNALALSGAPWKVAFGYDPYLSDGAKGNAGNYGGDGESGAAVKAFFDGVLCGKVDLFLAAGDPSLQVLGGPDSCPGTFVVAGTGGTAPGPIVARDGNDTLAAESSLGFVHLKLTRKKITLKLVDDSAEVLYKKTLKK